MRTRIYHKENCDACVREVFTDKYGRRIIVTGQFAFSWSIHIIVDKTITTFTYQSGKEARAQIRILKRVK